MLVSDDQIEVTSEVIAAHEAGHAVAAIVFGASFAGIKIRSEGYAVAQVVGISGLSDLGKARTFLAGTAGEEVGLGTSDLRLSSMDRRLMMQAIKDPSELGYAEQRAIELIQKYKTAHAAISQLILCEIDSGTNEVIPADRVIEVARINDAPHGAEEPGL